MSDYSPKILIIDMLDAISAILAFSGGLSYEDYLRDRKTRDALYRNIMVLGEAVHRLPHQFILAHPEIEWKKIESTRNALVHGYDKIDDRIVWNIIQNILPGLKVQLENLKAQL
ncbi:MAG: HepT-like ribonuclease domain-containing protein [Bacteroidia bacterium]